MIEDRLAVSASGEDSARQFKVDVRNGDSLGLTTRAIEKQIAKLREKSRLRRIGPAWGGRWQTIEKGDA